MRRTKFDNSLPHIGRLHDGQGSRVEKGQVVPFLRRLARRGACARRSYGDVRGVGGWHIVSTSQGRVEGAQQTDRGAAMELRPQGPVWSGELVQQALSEGLVELSGEELRLSSGGAAFLRRASAVTGDAYGAQHQMRSERVLEDQSRVTVNECESPLGWLRNRKDRKTGKPLISRVQFEAGERLRQDFYRAQMQARVTADWSGGTCSSRGRRRESGDGGDIADAAIAARTRFYSALESVGEELADVLIWICCDGRGLRDVEREAGWPQRSGKLVLQMALRALARHYGFEPSRRTQGRSGSSIGHWGAENYRPQIDGDGAGPHENT